MVLVLLDVNECLSNVTNACEQKCVNYVGSFSCNCETGYALNEDGKSCDGEIDKQSMQTLLLNTLYTAVYIIDVHVP